MKTHVLLAGLLALSTLHAAEQRTWTSKDGGATMVASFNKLDGDNVVLILANGRSQTVDKKFLSDADVQWIEENEGASEADGAAASDKIATGLAGKLVDWRGEDAGIAGSPNYYLFYYSASWCGPCQAFTPKLARFNRAQKANVQIVMVPYDKSLEDAKAYMKDHRMPWPGVKFDNKDDKAVPRFPGGGIPGLLLTDADGKRLLDTGSVADRDDFLKQAEAIFKGKASTAAN